MIETGFHPLDEIRQFGFTWHGLAEGGAHSPKITIDGVTRALPFNAPTVPFAGDIDSGGDTHLLQVPDIGPVPFTPEELAAEAAEGRVWQNYALISGGNLDLFGKSLGGWVCIDPAGKRWLVRTSGFSSFMGGEVTPGESATFHFSVVPFGYLNEPAAAAVEFETVLADVGQADIPIYVPPINSLFQLGINSISSDGRRVIVYIRNRWNFQGTRRAFPIGYLLLTLSGDGPDFVPTMEVLYTRADCFPLLVTEGTVAEAKGWDFEAESDTVEKPPGSGNMVTRTWYTGLKYVAAGAGIANVNLGAGDGAQAYKGRIITVVFDEFDVIRTFYLDASSSNASSFPEFSFSSSGYLYSDGTGDLTYEMHRSTSAFTTVDWIVRKDDLEVERVTWSATQSGTEGTGGNTLTSIQRLEIRGLDPMENTVSFPSGAPFGDKPFAGPLLISSSGPIPHLFDGRWIWTLNDEIGWPEVVFGVERHSNQVVAITAVLRDLDESRFANYTTRVVATGATWDGEGEDEAFTRVSTYEPKRKLITTDASGELDAPCWI